MSLHVFTKICEKQHEIACFLTRLTRRTSPAGRATPHICLPNMKFLCLILRQGKVCTDANDDVNDANNDTNDDDAQ